MIGRSESYVKNKAQGSAFGRLSGINTTKVIGLRLNRKGFAFIGFGEAWCIGPVGGNTFSAGWNR